MAGWHHVTVHPWYTDNQHPISSPYHELAINTPHILPSWRNHSGSPHDDVIKWKHFPRYWPFARGIHWSPVNSPHQGQWRGALMFSLICVSINNWVNNRESGDLRRYRAYCDAIVMITRPLVKLTIDIPRSHRRDVSIYCDVFGENKPKYRLCSVLTISIHFQVWTEYPNGEGSSNYLPGAGGYIQSLIFGFAGLRIRPQMLEFHNPTVPGASILKLNGFKYMGVNMTILIAQQFVQITVHNILDPSLGNIILKRNHSNLVQPEEVLFPGTCSMQLVFHKGGCLLSNL